MQVESLHKNHISLSHLFRFNKEEQLEKGWVNMPSSCSWTLDDKDSEAGIDDIKASTAHSSPHLPKIGRSKSLEEALRPMASLRASLAGMRSYSFRKANAIAHSRNDVNLLQQPDNDMSLDDSSGVSFHEDASVVTNTFSDVSAIQIVFPPRQEGTLIRRRRSKQLSKGRQSMRKIAVRTIAQDPEKIWNKFVDCASSPSSKEGEGQGDKL